MDTLSNVLAPSVRASRSAALAGQTPTSAAVAEPPRPTTPNATEIRIGGLALDARTPFAGAAVLAQMLAQSTPTPAVTRLEQQTQLRAYSQPQAQSSVATVEIYSPRSLDSPASLDLYI